MCLFVMCVMRLQHVVYMLVCVLFEMHVMHVICVMYIMAGRKAALQSHTSETQNETTHTTKPSPKSHNSQCRNITTRKIQRAWTLNLTNLMSESFNTKNIIGMDPNSTKKSVCICGVLCACVQMLRRWLSRHCGGGIQLVCGPMFSG